jgi:hypothetical protein
LWHVKRFLRGPVLSSSFLMMTDLNLHPTEIMHHRTWTVSAWKRYTTRGKKDTDRNRVLVERPAPGKKDSRRRTGGNGWGKGG